MMSINYEAHWKFKNLTIVFISIVLAVILSRVELFHSKYFNWVLPIIGAIIIASPFPDELGVSLMGLSKMSVVRFILLSYFLNSIGIFLVVSASVFIMSATN